MLISHLTSNKNRDMQSYIFIELSKISYIYSFGHYHLKYFL